MFFFFFFSMSILKGCIRLLLKVHCMVFKIKSKKKLIVLFCLWFECFVLPILGTNLNQKVSVLILIIYKAELPGLVFLF